MQACGERKPASRVQRTAVKDSPSRRDGMRRQKQRDENRHTKPTTTDRRRRKGQNTGGPLWGVRHNLFSGSTRGKAEQKNTEARRKRQKKSQHSRLLCHVYGSSMARRVASGGGGEGTSTYPGQGEGRVDVQLLRGGQLRDLREFRGGRRKGGEGHQYVGRKRARREEQMTLIVLTNERRGGGGRCSTTSRPRFGGPGLDTTSMTRHHVILPRLHLTPDTHNLRWGPPAKHVRWHQEGFEDATHPAWTFL